MQRQLILNSSIFVSERGYGILPGIFYAADLCDLAKELSSQDIRRSRAGARHVLSCASVAAIANSHALLELARSVLGNGALPFRATYFDKSPASNWLVAWHQDTALPLTNRAEVEGWGPWSTKDGVLYAHAPAEALQQVLALRVHLDDSTSSNGPLRVIPGTHRMGVLTDAKILEQSANASAVECTVQVGGVIAMHPLLIHASSKSESELPRRVLHIEYASRIDIDVGLQLAIV